MSKSKVEIQKGKINPAEKTMKTMTQPEKLRERDMQLRDLRDCQTLKMHTPKKGK